jgi:Tfp pilus assembly protein PilF
MDKIAALTEILAADPGNAFARYGLAMEYVARENPAGALAEFALCVTHNPDYVPAYQMSAQTLITLGHTEAALERLELGLGAARRSGNEHALAEMSAMRDELLTR